MTHSFSSRYRKGFTLVEMVLYVSLCSFILLGISVFLSFLLEVKIKTQTINEVNGQGNFVMTMMTKTIRNATSVQSPSSGVSSSTLSITTKIPAKSPTLFYVASSTFYIKEGNNQPIPLTNSRVLVASPTFSNIASPTSTEMIFRLMYTISHKPQSARQEYSFSKDFIGSATLRK